MTRKSRDPLSPKPILDRVLLSRALLDANIHLKANQLDSFYQQLHRQHYPPLADFVRNYYDARKVNNSDSNTFDKKSKKKNTLLQLPKAFLSFLSETDESSDPFATITSSVSFRATSSDTTTTKLAVTLQDSHNVEAVIMRHGGTRNTLCLSSQVGCAMGCTFCATGTMGIRGNLTSGEILEQIVHAERILRQETGDNDKIRNVVFMGMGEPLNNYSNVVEACRGLMDRRRWNLAHHRVTVSTVGVTPKMKQLTKDLPEVNLALSLHAPNQKMRVEIVPAAKSYSIEGLVQALDDHMMAGGETRSENVKRKRAMIEYVMLTGPTSTFEAAHELGKLCENRQLVVNLIPYNQTDVKDVLSCPSELHVKQFQDIVQSYGAFCFIRRTMGADIDSACGQLVQAKKAGKTKSGDIEDVGSPLEKQKHKNVVKKGTVVMKSSRKDTKKDLQATEDGNKENLIRNKNGRDIISLERFIIPLAASTAVAATCLIVSSLMLVKQRRR